MARKIRSSQLESRTARLKLPIRWKPYAVRVAPGVRLAYRRNETAGRWSAIVADGAGGNWMKGFAVADDHESADGETILDFWQAQDRARILARGGDDAVAEGRPVSVDEALDRYEADLETRSGDVGNANRVRVHLSDTLAEKAVALLTTRELRRWRDALKKELAAASINRVASAFRAALNLVADTDERISSRRAWEIGLQAIPDATMSDNIILPIGHTRQVVAKAYDISEQFGLLTEIAATTGARVGQLARLEVQDVQGDRADPRLMMPSSRKGRGQKKITRRPVPIPHDLAVRLRHLGKHRADNAPLLTKPNGEPWKKSDHTRLFRRAVMAAGLDPADVTIYALRHSNIVRQLLANVPIRVVAVNHDTSVAMVEKTYSKYIGDHADALVRPALFDMSETWGGNVVVALPQAKV